MTDIITFILSFYLLVVGAARGFIRSLLVPLSIIIATIIGLIFYQLTKNLLLSLCIGIIGPFLLQLLLKFLLKKWAQFTNTQIKPDWISRLGGAALSLAWGWVLIISALVLVAVLPPWGKTMIAVQHDVTHSASYFFAKPVGEKFFAAQEQTAAETPNGPSSLDAKSLAEDPRFQKVLQDPEIQKEIEAHDMVKLMSNPAMVDLVQQIIQDPKTMKKVLALYSAQPPSTPDVAGPETKNP